MAVPYSAHDHQPAIIDAGCHSIRLGFAGEHLPQCIFPPLAGISASDVFPTNSILFPLNPAVKKDHVDLAFALHYAVSSASSPGILKFDFPIFEKVLDHAVGSHGLDSSLSDHPMVLTENNLTNLGFRENILEILFEGFRTPSIFFGKKAALAAYAVGKTSGFVLDIGASNSNLCFVSEGYVLPKTIVEYPIGGNFLDCLTMTLVEKISSTSTQPTASSPSSEKPNASALMPLFAVNTLSSSADASSSVSRISCIHVCASYMKWARLHVATLLKEEICKVASTLPSIGEDPMVSSSVLLPDGTPVDASTIGLIRTAIPSLLFSPTKLLENPAFSSFLAQPFLANLGRGEALSGEIPFIQNGGHSSNSALTSSNGISSFPSTASSFPYSTYLSVFPGLAGLASMSWQLAIAASPTLLPSSGSLSPLFVVCGGSTRFPDFMNTLQQTCKLHEVFSAMETPVELVASQQEKERQFASWIGGSIIGSLGSFSQFCVTAEEYAELGARVAAERKCP